MCVCVCGGGVPEPINAHMSLICLLLLCLLQAYGGKQLHTLTTVHVTSKSLHHCIRVVLELNECTNGWKGFIISKVIVPT